MNQFDGIKHFNERENWGDPSRFSRSFLLKLDGFREETRQQFIIDRGYAPNAKLAPGQKSTQHHEGNAIDGHPKRRKGRSLFEYYLIAERYDFHGIGLYPNKGQWFLHLDERELPDIRRARWIRANSGVYYPLNEETLKKYVI